MSILLDAPIKRVKLHLRPHLSHANIILSIRILTRTPRHQYISIPQRNLLRVGPIQFNQCRMRTRNQGVRQRLRHVLLPHNRDLNARRHRRTPRGRNQLLSRIECLLHRVVPQTDPTNSPPASLLTNSTRNFFNHTFRRVRTMLPAKFLLRLGDFSHRSIIFNN